MTCKANEKEKGEVKRSCCPRRIKIKRINNSNGENITYVLVCNGAADKFVSQEDKDNFKNQMNAVGAAYEFKEYEGALHAFTNPESTEAGKKFNMPIAYNAAADSASWNDMKEFFSKYFPVN